METRFSDEKHTGSLLCKVVKHGHELMWGDEDWENTAAARRLKIIV
jgi:hypothetical protein